MENNILVSIILPVYNGERYLNESIESCLNQTYSNLELIIVNDCSSDRSLEIANSYAEKDTRVRVLDNEVNKKLPATLNVGHREAKGAYITWTSDDNKYKPKAIEKYLTNLQNNKSDFVCSDFDVIDEDGEFVLKTELPNLEELIWGNVFGASFMYSRVVFEELNGYNEDLFLVEDYDFWLRAFLKFKCSRIDESLYLYRRHGTSLSAQIFDNPIRNKLWKKNSLTMMTSFFGGLSLEEEDIQMLSKFVVDNYTVEFTGSHYINNHVCFEKLQVSLDLKFGNEFANKFKKSLAAKIFTNIRRDATLSLKEVFFLLRTFDFMYKINNGLYLLKRGIKNIIN